MKQIILRPDQLQVKNEIYTAWSGGSRVALAIATTGFGKSILMSDIAVDVDRMGASLGIIAHRKELVGQMAMHIAERGIKHRVIAPADVVRDIANEQREELGKSYVNPDARCAVAGIDTINSRAAELGGWLANLDYWFGDEGHHYLRANKWGRGIDLIGPQARGLLVTACPERADGIGLGRHAGGYADALILGPTMRQSIDSGAITDYEIAIPESDFVIDEDSRGKDGDFTRPKMREASKRSHIVGDVVKEYSKRAYGKRAICFATDVETSNEIARKFNDAGIPAVSLSAQTPRDVRRDMIKRFRDGRIWVLVNVDLFDEGFDVPACEVVIMARPTTSLNKYLQMIGRGLRVFAGKLFGLIIDHVSNWKRHGLPDKPRHWTLDNAERGSKREADPEDIPCTACKNCSRPYERFHAVCPYCGFAPPLPEPADRTLKQVDGDLMLLDRATLALMRANMELESPASVAERVGMVAGEFAGRGAANRALEKHSAQERLSNAIAQWAGIQRAKGRSDSESYRRFYISLGMDVLSALNRDRSRADFEKTAEIVEGWL